MRTVPPTAVFLVLSIFLTSLLAGDALAQRGGVDMRWRWPEGRETRFEMVEEMTQEMGAGTRDAKTRRWNRRIEFTEKVVRSDEEESFVERTITRVVIDADDPEEGRVQYDSDQRTRSPHREAESHRLVRPFARMVGQKVSFAITHDGTITDARGGDDLFNAMFAELDISGMPGLSAGAGGGDYRSQIEQSFRVIPRQSVTPGSSWDARVEHSIGPIGRIVEETRHTLRGRPAGGRARINSEGRMSIRLAGGLDGAMGIRINDATHSGETVFDLEAGQIVEQKSNIDWSFTVDGVLLDPSRALEDPGEQRVNIRQSASLRRMR
ncbi:MAG: hypothetical protein JJU33_02145 [Phycisphaerales bacterium]|nr:hypothetical protein [Phycisphaerales bacterium]